MKQSLHSHLLDIICWWLLQTQAPSTNIPDIFESATFSFRIQKYSYPQIAYSTRICPSRSTRNVSGFTLILRTPQGNRGNRACAIKKTNTALGSHLENWFQGRNWARSRYVIRIKKFPDLASTRFRIHSVATDFRYLCYIYLFPVCFVCITWFPQGNCTCFVISEHFRIVASNSFFNVHVFRTYTFSASFVQIFVHFGCKFVNFLVNFSIGLLSSLWN